MCKTQAQAVLAEKRMRDFLAYLGLELNATKTPRVDLREGKGGFDFLGLPVEPEMECDLLRLNLLLGQPTLLTSGSARLVSKGQDSVV